MPMPRDVDKSVVISLLLPTRGRPALVQRLFKSVAEMTARLDRIEVILYVDEDDVGSHHLDSRDFKVVRIIGPRLSMGDYNSACLRRARGEAIVLANDDMVVRTPGWDNKVAAMHAGFPDGIYLAYPNDLFKNGRLATFPILSRRCCEVLGDPYPSAYRGAFIDAHLFDLFKRLKHAGLDRIRYLDDVIFEHLHYRSGKAAYDETYRMRGRFADDFTFIAMAQARSDGAKRLLSVLRGEPIAAAEKANCVQYVPAGIFSAVRYFGGRLLFDSELPFRWRGFLFYWYIGRYLAGRGLLGPFVRVGGPSS
jgi:glycosyltransferase involved in cell wall biosynthesis